jgi:protoporphyrinogen oxidase
MDRWVHFPLKPLDLLFKLPLRFSMGATLDLAGKALSGNHDRAATESFASALYAKLGHTICHKFYFPYATKIWGLPPEKISAVQARRRVSTNSLIKVVSKILSATTPGLKPKGSGRFFYPHKGFSQICNSLYSESANTGAQFYLGAGIKSIQTNGNVVEKVSFKNDREHLSLRTDHVWSTIPITTFVQALKPDAPTAIRKAAKAIEFRSMILIYLVLEQERFSEYDAHYFPSPDIPISRLSEPRNYSNRKDPMNRTVLCAELPCSTTDPEWTMTNGDLGTLVRDSLEVAGVPLKAPLIGITTHRLTHAYPIYELGYDGHFKKMDTWLSQFRNLVFFGRQGLFVHDNTHHALHMGYCAVDCLEDDGFFDRSKWEDCRRVFETHVVED